MSVKILEGQLNPIADNPEHMLATHTLITGHARCVSCRTKNHFTIMNGPSIKDFFEVQRIAGEPFKMKCAKCGYLNGPLGGR